MVTRVITCDDCRVPFATSSGAIVCETCEAAGPPLCRCGHPPAKHLAGALLCGAATPGDSFSPPFLCSCEGFVPAEKRPPRPGFTPREIESEPNPWVPLAYLLIAFWAITFLVLILRGVFG